MSDLGKFASRNLSYVTVIQIFKFSKVYEVLNQFFTGTYEEQEL